MVALLLGTMFLCLALNFPMIVAMVVAPLLVMIFYMPSMDIMLSVQQLIAGVNAQVLLSVPMFILAADIMSTGHSTNRLLDFVEAFVGHIRGGMAITTAAACTLFGAISGSTQATVVAIGKPMRGRLLQLGYPDSASSGLIINSAIIALLIPPSISMIMYAVVTGASVGDLFIAGVGPGILMFLLFAVYSYFFIFKTIKLKDIKRIALSTAVSTSIVFILVAGGQLFSWVISFAKIPQMMTNAVLGANPSATRILVTVTLFFFIAGMFVDSLVAIIILSPIFYPIAMLAGIDPIHLGIVITLQAAIASVSPPFGCNIFTACAIFNRPYLDIVKGIPPYLIMLLLTTIIVIFVPELSLFLL